MLSLQQRPHWQAKEFTVLVFRETNKIMILNESEWLDDSN